jgi:hypothetical protein
MSCYENSRRQLFFSLRKVKGLSKMDDKGLSDIMAFRI